MWPSVGAHSADERRSVTPEASADELRFWGAGALVLSDEERSHEKLGSVFTG